MNTGYNYGGSVQPTHPPKQNVQITEQQVRQYESKFKVLWERITGIPSNISDSRENIMRYGASPNSGEEISNLVLQAFAELSASGGGELYFPKGEWVVSSYDPITGSYVNVPDNVTIRGAGHGATILRPPDRGKGIFRIPGPAENITIEDIGFDWAGTQTDSGEESFIFLREGTPVKNITIQRNRFFDSNPPVPGSTGLGDRWAVSFSNETGGGPNEQVRILDNICTDSIQLIANSGYGYKGLWVQRNYIVDCEQNAIALCYTKSGGVLEDVWITDNHIIDSTALGVYAGPDKPTLAGGKIRNLVISGNTFRGSRHTSSHVHVFVRYPVPDAAYPDAEVDGIVVEGNIMEQGDSTVDMYGIRIFDDYGTGLRASNVTVRRNTYRGMRYSSWLSGIDSVEVYDERMIDTGGPQIRYCTGIYAHSNSQDGGPTGFIISGSSARLYRNLVKNVAGGFNSNGCEIQTPAGESVEIESFGNVFTDDSLGTLKHAFRHTGTGTVAIETVMDDFRGITDAVFLGTFAFDRIWMARGFGDNDMPAREYTVTSTISTPTIAAGGVYNMEVTVAGAEIGDHVQMALNFALPNGVVLGTPQVHTSGSMKVVVHNTTGAGVALSGNAEVLLRKAAA